MEKVFYPACAYSQTQKRAQLCAAVAEPVSRGNGWRTFGLIQKAYL
jgi:hypothetical protein